MKKLNELLNTAIKLTIGTLLWCGMENGFYSLWVGY